MPEFFMSDKIKRIKEVHDHFEGKLILLETNREKRGYLLSLNNLAKTDPEINGNYTGIEIKYGIQSLLGEYEHLLD